VILKVKKAFRARFSVLQDDSEKKVKRAQKSVLFCLRAPILKVSRLDELTTFKSLVWFGELNHSLS